MTVLLTILAVIVVTWAVAALGSVWLLARRNRVAPRARTGAPLHWLAAPSRAASAHRRLRRSLVGARAAVAAIPPDAPVRGDVASCLALLERQAVDLDHRLVVAAQCPAGTRWKLVNGLEPHVREVERIGSQLAQVAVVASPRPAGAAPGMEALATRLQALEDARAELDAMEREPTLPAGADEAAPPALGPGGMPLPATRATPRERVVQRRPHTDG
ncbi:MAG TPA: hypothetical protein VMU14_08685 [Acidimicrobiales bacterium]|nr:hypothetical protein [Acidimicrobiales bacterium]